MNRVTHPAEYRQAWIAGCERQIASMVDGLEWSDDDAECIDGMQSLVREYEEAVAS